MLALHTDLQVKLTARGIEVLGSPVGNKQFSADFVMDRVQRKSDLLNEIEQLASHDNKAAAQSALLLLRYCALPAVSHLLRTVPAPLADAAFIHHDDAVLHTVSKLIAPSDPLFRTPTEADELDDFTAQHQRLARLQLQLPLKHGGCGITSSTTTAPLAYVAAWRGCLSFLDEHADLFPAAQDSLTPQAFAAADADADVATAGPLDFLAAAWRDATLQLGGDEDMQAALGADGSEHAMNASDERQR